jgi:hypothetical protein
MYPVTSRYHGIETASWTTADGREIVYLRRRFLPSAADVVVLAEHTVTEGDRLDNVTAQYLGDPEQFWRLCDANDAMHPAGLTAEIGRRLRIPLLQGG